MRPQIGTQLSGCRSWGNAWETERQSWDTNCNYNWATLLGKQRKLPVVVVAIRKKTWHWKHAFRLDRRAMVLWWQRKRSLVASPERWCGEREREGKSGPQIWINEDWRSGDISPLAPVDTPAERNTAVLSLSVYTYKLRHLFIFYVW
jgi:hypothetical protein